MMPVTDHVYAYNMLKGVTDVVSLRDNVLTLTDPLDVPFPVESYEYFVLPDKTRGCLILVYTYTKWSIYYAIHEPKHKLLEGYCMFKHKPTTVELEHIDYLDSYCVLARSEEAMYCPLISSNPKAKMFASLWSALSSHLIQSHDGSIWFEDNEAIFSQEGKQYLIDWIDSNQKDIIMKLHEEEQPRVYAQCSPRVEFDKIINLYRRDE